MAFENRHFHIQKLITFVTHLVYVYVVRILTNSFLLSALIKHFAAFRREVALNMNGGEASKAKDEIAFPIPTKNDLLSIERKLGGEEAFNEMVNDATVLLCL